MLWCGPKLATSYVGSRASWNVVCCRPSLAVNYALLGATWYELQRDLQMFATCTWLRGASKIQAVKQGLLPLVRGSEMPNRGTDHAKARCCFFNMCEPFRDFKKVCSMRQDKLFKWKIYWKYLG